MCMYVYVVHECVSMSMYIYISMIRSQHQVSSSTAFHLTVFRQGLSRNPELIISAGVVASEPTRPLLPHFQLPGQVLRTWAAFCISARSLNSGPHSCTASTLPTESAQPLPLLLTLVLILLKVLSLRLKCKFLSDSCQAASVVEY